MPLDSLGLGLTLDTTLLEKADKTLENMHKNSKLIMQNLTRGISAFNSGAITDFADVLNNVQEALSKMDGTKMSIDYDKKGLEGYKRGINDILDLTVRLSEKFGDMKFYDPKRVNRTDESPYEVRKRLNELLEEYKTFEAKLNKADEFDADSDKYTKQLTDSKAEIEKLTPSVEKLKEAYDKAKDAYQKYVDTQSKKIREKTPEATDEEIHNVLLSRDAYIKKATAMLEAQKAYKEEESLLKAQQKLYGDASAAKYFSENRQDLEENSAMLRESIKNAQADLAWANKTIAEKDEELLKDQKARDNEEKSRIAGIQSTYKEIRKAIEQGEKELAEAEKRRDTIAKGKGDTSEYDAKIQELKAFLDEKKDIETSWRKSQYWPALEAIDKQFNKKKLEDDYKQRLSSPTVAFANQYSKNATSIDEETQAVKMLEAARDSLSNSTAHYDQVVNALNKRIAKHEDHIKLLTQEQKESKELQDSVISRYIREKKEIKELNKVLKELHEKQASTGIKTAEEDKYEQDIIARRQRLWNDVHQIEVDNAKQITQLKEKYDASVAEEKIQEIIKTNEKEKQEYAKLLDDLYALEKQKKTMEAAGGGFGDKAYMELIKQETDLTTRKNQLEMQHQNDLDEIQKKHNKKRNDDEVKAFIDAQKEKQKIAEETQKKIDAYNEKYGTTSKKNAEMAITSYSGAQNINQHKQAIEGLQQVRARLDNTDKDYYETLKKLNREIHSHELFIRAAENESVRLGNSHRGLMDISGQLMRRLALVFSVSQITQYFRKLVEVRGQFEKTEVALTSIVGSQEKSNKLMNQTIALAIKSPFTLQQLTGYTKQLAAYQVAYEQLHDTTKMLADVSAGLGVEMDRLILAFGQVKAANYLRATEVRQFTEAGFNILGELAKYYTELEGTMVSVGDVQERVTKRMVDFADVEEIFHRVTEAGGMFYDMQSRQAETLAGQWTNLQDRIDVMLNEIGTDKENILKFFVRFLASAIDNWEVLASSIKTAAAAFLIFKTYSLLAGDGIKLLAIQMGVLTDTVPKVLSLGQAFNTLGRVVKSAVTKIGTSMSALLTNPIFLAIAAIGALIGAGISLGRHFKQMNEALKEQANSFNEYTSSLNKLSKEYNKLDKFTEKLAKLDELKSRLNERGLNLSVKIDEVNTDNIDEIFNENSEILQKSYELGLSVGKSITRGINAAQGNIFGWSTFGENLAEDAEDFASKWNKLASYGMDAQMRAMENEIEANEKASEAALAIYETIGEGRKAERDENDKIVKYLESEYEWTMRRAKALKEIQDLEDGSVTKNNRLARYIRQVTRQERELNHEVDNTINKLAKEFDGIENLMQAAKDNPVEFSAAIQAEVDKQAWDEVTKWVYSQKLHARLEITPNYVEDPNAGDAKKLAQFQQDLVDARANLEKKGKGYQNFFISKEEIEQMKLFSDGIEGIQKLYDDNRKTIEQLDGTAEDYNKDELARLNALQNALKEVAKKWGYNLDLNAKGDESEALKKLKDQIKLIKEANKAYEERNKKFGKVDSQAVVTDSYKDAFKEVELAIEDIDYTNLEGVVDALESLEAEAKKAGGKVDLLKAISEVKAEIGLTLKERQDEVLFSQVQELFDDYELAVDIKKLNLSPELAKNLFGVDTKSFDQMRTEIISKFAGTNKTVSEILSKGYEVSAEDEKILIEAIGKDRVDKAKEALEKIQDLEDKAQLERLKKYVEYAKKAIGERAKIKLEELRKLKEIEETFKEKEGDSKETRQYKQNMAKDASAQVKKEADQELKRLDWQEFEKSDMFVNLFKDLEGASDSLLNHAINKLQMFKEEWKDMPLEDVRQIVEKMNELEDALINIQPIQQMKEAKKKVEEAIAEAQMDASHYFESSEAREKFGDSKKKGAFIQAIQEESVYQEQQKADAQEQITYIETALRLLEGKATANDKLLQDEEEIQAYMKLGEQALRGQLTRQKDIITSADKILARNEDIVDANQDYNKGLSKVADYMDDAIGMANDLYEAFKSLSVALGADEDSPAMIFADMGMSIMSSLPQMLSLIALIHTATVAAEGMGAAMNMAMGIVGLIVMGIQLVVQAINAIVSAADKKVDAQVEKLIDQADELNEKYSKLADSIDEIYNVRTLEETSRQLDELYEKEKRAIEAAIAARKADKNISDEEKDEIKNLEKRLVEIEENHMGKMKDIVSHATDGILDSVYDAAREFTDAWYEAYAETGDGLKGLEDNFNEMFLNLAKNQAAMQITDTFVKRWKDALATYVNEKDTELSPEDAAAWAEQVKATFPELNDALEGFLGVIHDGLGTQGGGLSGLQKGIQGITEDTAQIIEAYLNSVRGYVSEQVTYTKKIYNMFYAMTTGSANGLNVRLIP